MSVLKAALLGRTLDHSISPQVHRAIFTIVRSKVMTEFDSIDYSNIECADVGEFMNVVKRGSEKGFIGFNITFPYKYLASTLASDTSSIVKQINSANTIRRGNPNQIISTDGFGFRFALDKALPGLAYSDYSLTILGNGGAARAILNAIDSFGWRRITKAARTYSEKRSSDITPLQEVRRDGSKQFVVQATPVGQRTRETLLQDFDWRPGDIAVDLVYNPLRTRFLDIASNGGAFAIDGLGMLIEQAALSQYFWITGNESIESILTEAEHIALHNSLSKLVTPRWDAFAS
jgi:shikimate dehydrogenase